MAATRTRQTAPLHSLDYKLYFESVADGKLISPFHDIPLYANADKTVLNMVVEIPRWSNAKLEISKDLPFNPIKQDVKKGKLRFVRNCFPHKGYIWNYGAFPQTWEDPTHSHPDTGAIGDNDPLDVVEIGEQVAAVGQVKQVKVLGVMALLDEGETDWKVITIDVNDPLAPKLNDIRDVETYLPGLLAATTEWFRIYKVPDGKPENEFAFGGQAKDKAYALKIVQETHEAWQKLSSGQVPNKTDKYDIKTENTTLTSSKYRVDVGSEVYKTVPAAIPQPIVNPVESGVDKWFFVKSAKVCNL